MRLFFQPDDRSLGSVAANSQTASGAQTLAFSQVGEAPGGFHRVPCLVGKVPSPGCNLYFWDI